MSTTTQRVQLVSTGEHVYAIRRLGDSYTAEEYLRAVKAARDAGDGEAYADAVLGVDVDSVLRGVTEKGGEVTVRAAESLLRGRGVDPATASYREFADALIEVSE
jgi:hypothetical protein